jgi:hypothetical protein
MMRAWITSSVALACLACGGDGGDGAPTTVNGTTGNTVNGTFMGTYTLYAKDAVFNVGEWSGFYFYGPTTGIVIADYASLCSYESLDQAPPNTQGLALVLGQIDAAGNASAVTATGDYLIPTSSADYRTPNTLRAAAWWEFGGARCFRAADESAMTGTGHVVVTSVSAARIAGTFDVVFTPSGDRMTGSFDAASCPGVNLNRSPSCPP